MPAGAHRHTGLSGTCLQRRHGRVARLARGQAAAQVGIEARQRGHARARGLRGRLRLGQPARQVACAAPSPSGARPRHSRSQWPPPCCRLCGRRNCQLRPAPRRCNTNSTCPFAPPRQADCTRHIMLQVRGRTAAILGSAEGEGSPGHDPWQAQALQRRCWLGRGRGRLTGAGLLGPARRTAAPATARLRGSMTRERALSPALPCASPSP